MRRGIGLRGYARHRSAERVQARGVQAVRGAARLHQQAGCEQHLPSPGDPERAATRADDDDVDLGDDGHGFDDDHHGQRAAGHAHSGRGRARSLRWHVPRGRAAAGVAAAPAVVPPALAAVARRGIQYQHGDEPVAERRRPGRRSTNSAAKAAPASNGPKVGRNDPCWCGSGKKFKRCHGSLTSQQTLTPAMAGEERILDWEGALNARDTGGLPTADGRQIRRGALVRSDVISRLTPCGRAGAHRPWRAHDRRRAHER